MTHIEVSGESCVTKNVPAPLPRWQISADDAPFVAAAFAGVTLPVGNKDLTSGTLELNKRASDFNLEQGSRTGSDAGGSQAREKLLTPD